VEVCDALIGQPLTSKRGKKDLRKFHGRTYAETSTAGAMQ
jgi:hypothetical protein